MSKHHYCLTIFILLGLVITGWSPALSAPVGQFIQVEGQVDLLKVGKLPAQAVKVQDGVEVGDVVRTKSRSRAQIKMVDDTALTIAPESKVTIEEFMFDGAKGERRAVMEVFRGLVHTTVNKIFPGKDPDFIMKTHTVVLGVRGTKWYTKLTPNATEIYTEGSKLEVRHRNPLITGVRIMEELQYLRADLKTLGFPINITREDLKPLEQGLKSGTEGTGQTDTGPGKSPLLFPMAVVSPVAPLRAGVENISTGFYVPPSASTTTALLVPFYIQIIWGEGARDLDLWLTGPKNGSRFQVYYGSRGSLTEVPFAQYYNDCTTAGGSEVIRVERFLQGGLYRVTVHNFTEQNNPDSTTLSNSANLTLELIKGGTVVNRPASGGGMGSIVQRGQTILSLTPPSNQAGVAWTALEINPANGQVNKVNRIDRTFNP